MSKDNACKNSACTCTPNCKCINCTCGAPPGCVSKECSKQSAIHCFVKNREGTSFTELLKTPNAAVKYTVHSSEDGKGLPDIELSVCKDGKECMVPGATVVPVNCGKIAGAGCCGGGSNTSGVVKNVGAKATPSEIADIAKLIKEHERDNEELKKLKEGKASGGGGGGGGRAASTESMKETVQTQLQKWKMKATEKKAAEPKPATGNNNVSKK